MRLPTPEAVVWSMPGLVFADAIEVAVTNVGVPDFDTLSLGGRDSDACE